MYALLPGVIKPMDDGGFLVTLAKRVQPPPSSVMSHQAVNDGRGPAPSGSMVYVPSGELGAAILIAWQLAGKIQAPAMHGSPLAQTLPHFPQFLTSESTLISQ